MVCGEVELIYVEGTEDNREGVRYAYPKTRKKRSKTLLPTTSFNTAYALVLASVLPPVSVGKPTRVISWFPPPARAIVTAAPNYRHAEGTCVRVFLVPTIVPVHKRQVFSLYIRRVLYVATCIVRFISHPFGYLQAT